MNRTYVTRVVAGTLVVSCALGGLYIGSPGIARAAAAAALQAGGPQIHALAVNALYKPRSQQAAGHQDADMPPIVSEAASILGMNVMALKEQLQSGKSIADVAQSRGMSESDLTAKLLQIRHVRIDEAVKNGQLDAARAEQMKQRMSQHLRYMVKEKRLLEKDTYHKGHGWKPSHEDLAAIMGLSNDQLREQLKAGKSLSEIAAGKGISREELIARLKKQLTPQLESWVDRKHPAAAVK